MAKSNSELTAKIASANPTNGGDKPLTVEQQVRHFLDRMKPQMAAALPKHMTPDRMARIALTSIRTTPKLLECTIDSLMGAVMQASQLGLEPGLLGQCYLVPYGRVATFIIGYKGYLDLARRSGQIKTIQASPVYSKDKFTLQYGFDPKLEHEPTTSDDRGTLLGFYAYAITKDGGIYCEFMSKKQVDEIRKRSKASGSGPWVTDYDQMGRKTVLRRLSNYLPMSVEVATSLAEDAEREFGAIAAVDITPALTGIQASDEGGLWPRIERDEDSPRSDMLFELETTEETAPESFNE